MKAKIKEQNYWMLKDFGLRGIQARPEVHGDKLKAIFRLIEKRGELIKTNDPSISELKALEFGDGEYIAIKRTGPKNGNFYPCAIKTVLLTTLKTN